MTSPQPIVPVALVAALIQPGSRILLPDGTQSDAVTEVKLLEDDFGNPALQLLTLTDGAQYRIAIGASVRVVTPTAMAAAARAAQEAKDAAAQESGTSPLPKLPAIPARHAPHPDVLSALMTLPVPEHEDEELLRALASSFENAPGIGVPALRLSKGINHKSGSALADLRSIARQLFLDHDEALLSLQVLDVLNRQALDDNPARWDHIEAALSLSAYLSDELGQEDRAAAYRTLLRAPLGREVDEFRARLQERIRQRRLDEPNLYDSEIFRAVDGGNREAEREWRILRLETLLHLLADGGSRSLPREEIQRRVNSELDLIKG